MSRQVAILRTSLITSLGMSSAASCAAIRAGISNATETIFKSLTGEPIFAHQVPLEKPWSARAKLRKMAVKSIIDCLMGIPRNEWKSIPVYLCVSEPNRPGRLEGIDAELLTEIQRELDTEFSDQSQCIPLGRVGVTYALMKASTLIDTREISKVLIVAVDSLLSFITLVTYESNGRLLNAENSNGFLPGEGAGALLVGFLDSGARLQFMGAGFGVEEAVIASEKPLRGIGLASAIREALANADCQIHDLDFRITDLSGEQYYFKEASLALTRILRVRKEEFDIWHPAQCVGETGAVSGAVMVAVADAACRKGYAPGQKIICHASNDSGERGATIFKFQEC